MEGKQEEPPLAKDQGSLMWKVFEIPFLLYNTAPKSALCILFFEVSEYVQSTPAITDDQNSVRYSGVRYKKDAKSTLKLIRLVVICTCA